MTDKITLQKSKDGRLWVWVIVTGGGNEVKYFAVTDEDAGDFFIPVFATKDEAEDGQLSFGREAKGDLQKIEVEGLGEEADREGARVLLITDEGRTTVQLYPKP